MRLLQKLSILTIIIVVMFLIIITIVPANVSATTVPSDYSYKKSHTILGSEDGSLVDYQVKLIINRESGTDSGANVYLGDHSLSWPEDIRFTDNDNNQLSYWIQSYNNDIATVWIKINDIPAAPGSSKIFIYYGKENDAGDSNGQATFPLLFDSFDGQTIDSSKWNLTPRLYGPGSYRIETSILQMNGKSGYLGYTLCSLDEFNYNTALCMRWQTSGFDTVQYNEAGYSGEYSSPEHETAIYRGSYTCCNGSVSSKPMIGWSAGQFHVEEIARGGTTSRTFTIDNGYPVTITSALFNTPETVFFESIGVNGQTSLLVDWVFVRSYTLNEPMHGQWGNEVSTGSSDSLFGSLFIISNCLCCICGSVLTLIIVLVLFFIYKLLKK